MIHSLLTATEFRKHLFEILNLTVKGGEFVIEKDGRPAAKLVPYTEETSVTETKTILKHFRSAFSEKSTKEPWSVLDTKEWKEKEKKYLESLT